MGERMLPLMQYLPAWRARFFLISALLLKGNLQADPVLVRHPQDSEHGFVALKTLDGKRIATGDLTQIIHGDRVTSRLTFRFRDGSIDNETTVFSQRGTFRLIRDPRIQHGRRSPDRVTF